MFDKGYKVWRVSLLSKLCTITKLTITCIVDDVSKNKKPT